jgi:outer membrane protein assembly factor BamB
MSATDRPAPLPPFLRGLLWAGALLLLPGLVRAGDWPGWRGPTGAGYSDEKDLPLTWGKKDENVLWKVALEGRGYSSPVVWGERVFLTAAAKQSDQDVKNKVIPEHYVLCFRASDGKQLWCTVVPAGKWPDGYYAIATPVTDGRLVYAWFGSGVLAALDFDGTIVWRRERAGPYNVYPGVSSSPVLHGDTVLILCDQGKDSFLLAVDKKTGEVRWERNRTGVGSANSTPLLVRVKGRDQLVVAASNALQGLDPDTGAVLWHCAKDGGYWTSLTHGSGLVYTDSGGGRGVAVDPGGAGDVDRTHVKWQHAKVPEGLGCPIIVGDYLYRVHKPGVLKCWKLSTGEQVLDKRLDGVSYLSSPFATADGRIYFASAARGYVLEAGPEGKVLASNSLPGGDDGPSPAVAGGRIFLKSTSQLFCVGKSRPAPQ